MSTDDERVREAMSALREHDAATAPSFARVRERAMHRAGARARARRAVAWTGAVALAAIVLLAIWLRPQPSLGPAPTFAGTEPLAFLLQPPSASAVSAPRHLERSW